MIISVGSGPDNKIDSCGIRELLEAFQRAEQQSETILFKAAYPGRFFCSGFDLAQLMTCTESQVVTAFTDFLSLARMVFHSSRRVGVLCHGHAVGVGAMLVLAADRCVMHPSAKLRFPEVLLGLGLFADVVDLLRYRLLPRQVESFLREGRAVGASEALSLGLVDQLSDEVSDVAAIDFSGLPTAAGYAAGQMKVLCRDGFLSREPIGAQVERFMACWTRGETQALMRQISAA